MEGKGRRGAQRGLTCQRCQLPSFVKLEGSKEAITFAVLVDSVALPCHACIERPPPTRERVLVFVIETISNGREGEKTSSYNKHHGKGVPTIHVVTTSLLSKRLSPYAEPKRSTARTKRRSVFPPGLHHRSCYIREVTEAAHRTHQGLPSRQLGGIP